MKKSLLLVIAIAVFLAGLVLKIAGLPLSGIFMVVGLIVFIAYVIVSFTKKKSLTFSDIMIISGSVITAAVIFSIINNKVILWILICTFAVALIAYVIMVLMKNQKKE